MNPRHLTPIRMELSTILYHAARIVARTNNQETIQDIQEMASCCEQIDARLDALVETWREALGDAQSETTTRIELNKLNKGETL